MSISYWLDSKNKKQLTFDFCIIGAGIAGVSTAYWLEKKFPKAKIAIIERNKLGFGASGRNAGFVTCGSAEHFSKLNNQFGIEKATEIWRYSEENRALLQKEIIGDDANSVHFHQAGSCTVAPNASEWPRYQALAELMQSQKIDVRILAATELNNGYGVKNAVGAIEYRHDGIINPMMLLQKMFAKLKRTQLFENEEVFEMNDGTILTDQTVFKADTTLICLNGFLPLLGKEWLPHVKPQRGQVMVSEPLPAFVKGPCYLTQHLCYFRQLETGELLIGGFRNVDLDQENTFLDQPTAKIQNALFEFSKNYFEIGPQIKIKYQWSGIMGFTEDGQMLIGEHPQKKNVHLMAGCSGHGMGLSFRAALTLVESLEGKTIPSHLSVSRIIL